MQLHMPGAEIFVPDGLAEAEALARTTHLAIAAHQDDLEILAAHGALQGLGRPDVWFGGVVVTDGAGSPRDDLYADYTDEQMQNVRRLEQRKAAYVGEYSFQGQLMFASRQVKDSAERAVVEDLQAILAATRPHTVYTHNLGDKHDTHVAVALRVLAACRELPAAQRPARLWGGEVWRDLDWLTDEDKVPLDCSAHENLQAALLGVFDSQICGGKRYDLATMGRRKAHATYFASHGVDETTGLNFAMDLTPLLQDDALSPAAYVQGLIDRFADEVSGRIGKLG
ncbi:MAG TPA: PIG-L family deacetylase [Armatimonadota bacterium]|jgi:LmbE family N-acetylglucosaminyl deacetylase